MNTTFSGTITATGEHHYLNNTGGNSNLYIKASNSGNSRLYLGDVADAGVGVIDYAHGTSMTIGAGGAVGLTLAESDNTATFAHNVVLAATKALYFDGGSHTYIKEGSGDTLNFYTGGNNVFTVNDHLNFTGNLLSTGINLCINSQYGMVLNVGAAGANEWFKIKTGGSGTSDGTTHMQIGSDGKVGIGTTSPTDLVHIKGTSGNIYQKIEATGTNCAAGLYLVGHSGDESRLFFGDQNDSSVGKIVYLHDPNDMYFQTDGTRQMTLSSEGYLGIGEDNPDKTLVLKHSSSVDIKFTGGGSWENHYIRKDGHYLRFRGNDNSTILFELRNNNLGGNECSFPSANLGVGLSDPAYKLHVSGQIYATSNITAYSDIRIKKDIETIDNALDKVMLMRGVYYRRKDEGEDTSGVKIGQRCVGLIAQELQGVLPEVVNYSSRGDFYSVDYGKTVSVLIEAIKELKSEINELKGIA